jgi:hypothetical protein
MKDAGMSRDEASTRLVEPVGKLEAGTGQAFRVSMLLPLAFFAHCRKLRVERSLQYPMAVARRDPFVTDRR